LEAEEALVTIQHPLLVVMVALEVVEMVKLIQHQVLELPIKDSAAD
jgi:hypothetical protein